MKKQWKSISIDREVYEMLKNKQHELMNKRNGEYVELGYITERVILAGFDTVNFDED